MEVDFIDLMHEMDRTKAKEKALAYTHCVLCDAKFEKGRRGKHSAARDKGYDGIVCRWCIKTTIGYRIKDYKERARKVRTFSNLTRKQLFRLIIESSFCCEWCGNLCNFDHNSKKQLTIDHAYPLYLGGMNIKENLVVLCLKCHRNKDNYKGKKEFG